MRYYKENAYPQVILHDCLFRMDMDTEGLCFRFDDGFVVYRPDGTPVQVPGLIRIRGFDPRDLFILRVRTLRLFGRDYEWGRYLSPEELNKRLDGHRLILIDEYYGQDRFIWKCIAENGARRLPGPVEITVFHDASLSYFLAEHP